MAGLPEDILKRISKDFGDDDVEAAALLSAFFTEKWAWLEDKGRLCRCALHVAHGNMEKLKEAMVQARKDYRDLIVEGEYDVVDGKLVRVRSFIEPFG
jgi:hypothetical protein